MAPLDGTTIVLLTASSGVEQVELTRPWEGLRAAGACWWRPRRGRSRRSRTTSTRPTRSTSTPPSPTSTRPRSTPWSCPAARPTPTSCVSTRPRWPWPARSSERRCDLVDEQSFTCPANGWTLVTSRTPDDLDAFVEASVAAFAG